MKSMILRKKISEIEQFLVEIAANEEQIAFIGFKYALSLPTANSAINALKTFYEDFATLRRFMHQINKSYADELDQLEGNGKVIEEIAKIELQLRMAIAKSPVTSGISAANKILDIFPFNRILRPSRIMFDEIRISLQRTIIDLGKMKSTVGIFYEYISNRKVENDDVFKQSNISTDRVINLIDKALEELNSIKSLRPEELIRLQNYLLDAKKEALSPRPSWSKLIGALIIVAAFTSGLADAPGATKTIKDIIEYVLGTSIAKPLRELIPPPVNPIDSIIADEVII